MANTIAGKTKLAPVFFLIFGASLQVLGLALMLTLPATGPVTAPLYIYEVLIALGVGTSFGILVLTNPYTIEPQYIGTFLLSICTGYNANLRLCSDGRRISNAIPYDRINYRTSNSNEHREWTVDIKLVRCTY